MSEARNMPLFRFTCPHCQKVLKAHLEWAGKRGLCPGCNKSIHFPAYKKPSSNSRTAAELLKRIAIDDNITLDDNDTDRLSMLISQCTCRDFMLAKKLLDNRPLSPRQWRRILNSAAARESMRLHIEEQLDRLAEIPDDDEDPAALVIASESVGTNPNAWKVMARFLYFLRHDTCDNCKSDPTGLTCMYLTFESFCLIRQIQDSRLRSWHRTLAHHLGL